MMETYQKIMAKIYLQLIKYSFRINLLSHY